MEKVNIELVLNEIKAKRTEFNSLCLRHIDDPNYMSKPEVLKTSVELDNLLNKLDRLKEKK